MFSIISFPIHYPFHCYHFQHYHDSYEVSKWFDLIWPSLSLVSTYNLCNISVAGTVSAITVVISISITLACRHPPPITTYTTRVSYQVLLPFSLSWSSLVLSITLCCRYQACPLTYSI